MSLCLLSLRKLSTYHDMALFLTWSALRHNGGCTHSAQHVVPVNSYDTGVLFVFMNNHKMFNGQTLRIG